MNILTLSTFIMFFFCCDYFSSLFLCAILHMFGTTSASLSSLLSAVFCALFSVPPAQKLKVFNCFGAKYRVITNIMVFVLMQKTFFDTMERAGSRETLSEHNRRK